MQQIERVKFAKRVKGEKGLEKKRKVKRGETWGE